MAEGYACYRPVGQVSFEEAVALISQAIAFACDHQVQKLFVDTTKLTGFKAPGLWDRFALAEQCARAAKSFVAVALLARPEVIDPQRFGVTVARNRGLFANVFSSEAEALSWLQNPI